jgi:hypothetical protein
LLANRNPFRESVSMNWRRFFGCLALLPMGALMTGEAAATASLGGVVSALAGSGVCNDTKSVPLNTPQDTFALGAATTCSSGSASADIHGEAATASIGLRATSVGNGFGSSQAVALVGLHDYWLFSVPAGIAANTSIKIPVTIKLDGSISPGAVFDPAFGRFLDYNLTISDHYSPLSPTGQFAAIGNVSASGVFSKTFTGNVDFRYFGPGSLPMRADIELSLNIVSLLEGSVNFYNTASVSLGLPAGFSVTTSSGLPLVFAPVPEPATYAMLLTGLGLLGFAARQRRAVGAAPPPPQAG